MKVNKKYEKVTEGYKYNPISDPSLFPNIKEQIFYNPIDEEIYKKKGLEYTYRYNWNEIHKTNGLGLDLYSDNCDYDGFFQREIGKFFNPKYKNIECSSAFNPDKNINKYKIEEVLAAWNNPFEYSKNANIPDMFKYIAKGAFNHCCCKYVQFEGNGLEAIADYAFERSTIQTIVIPEGITSIPKGCFRYCQQLTNVILPSSLVEICDDAFSNTSITKMIISCDLVRIGKRAFYSCTKLTNVNSNINSPLTEISFQAFFNTNIKVIILPKSVPVVDLNSFDPKIDLFIIYIDTYCDDSINYIKYSTEEEFNSYIKKYISMY